MEIYIPKISLAQLSHKETDLLYQLKSENYGRKLAKKVAKKLMEAGNSGLYFAHRDYCGIGIFYQSDNFVLSTVYDGYGIDQVILKFDFQSEFIDWLANENDQSMSLYGEKFNNQTITKLRLDWFLEENYSPVWNSYCLYARKMQNE